MQRETSNDTFLDYGSVYHQPIDREHPELIHQTMVAITRRYVTQFYCFNCDTYLQVKSGIGVLLVSHTAEAADVQEFAMNRLIHIKPNIYFLSLIYFLGDWSTEFLNSSCRADRDSEKCSQISGMVRGS